MKKLLITIAATTLLVPSMFADLSATLYTQNDGQPSGYRDPRGWGGEFTAVLSGDSAFNNYVLDHYSDKAKATVTTTTYHNHRKYTTQKTGIETFCLETTVPFTPGHTYDASVGDTIQPGGSAIKVATAWLYSQFAQGTLAGYNYDLSNGGRETSANELQDAIWYLQGQITSKGYIIGTHDSINDSYTFDAATDPFLVAAQAIFGAGMFDAAEAGAYGVYALNLLTTEKGCTVYAQDQLIYCPVPEPATVVAGLMLLIPMGVSAFRILRKKTAN